MLRASEAVLSRMVDPISGSVLSPHDAPDLLPSIRVFHTSGIRKHILLVALNPIIFPFRLFRFLFVLFLIAR